MPTDSIANRLIVETHYYDPYDYTLNTSGPCLAWGAPYTQYSNCAWAQEAYVDDLFSQVKTKWVSAGIPVIIGEYGVIKRSGLDLNSRLYWNKYINQAAKLNGFKTFYWDNGTSEFAIFDRNTGAIVDQALLDAIKQGANVIGVPTPTRTFTPLPGFTPTRTNTPPPGFTPTRTNTPTVGPSLTPTRTFTPTTTGGGGACTPTSTVTAPFTWDGAGVFCWQIATVPSYINNWNNVSVTINNVNFTNVYVATGGLPAKINNNYYISYNSNVAWGHLEIR